MISGALPVTRPTRWAPRSTATGGMARIGLGLAAGTVLAQIAYPLLSGTARDTDTVLTVLLFCAASVSAAARRQGTAWAARFLLIAAGFGFAVEAIGTASSVPFGTYHYAGTLGPRLLAVPLVVPLAWAMMAYPALVVGRWIGGAHRPLRIAAGAAALATWDVFLDPQMVAAGHWRWPGSHALALAGVPVGNFAGWLLASIVLIALLDRLPAPHTLRDPADALPLGLYLWTYASSLLANLAFFHRPAVALAGGLAMGVPVALLVRARRAGPAR